MPEPRGLDALLFIAHSQAIPMCNRISFFALTFLALVSLCGKDAKSQLLVGAGGGGGLEGPGSGNSSGSSPGSSSGRDGSPGSRTGGGISGLGFPGGLSRGGSVGCPGVIGGSSVGSIGIATRSRVTGDANGRAWAMFPGGEIADGCGTACTAACRHRRSISEAAAMPRIFSVIDPEARPGTLPSNAFRKRCCCE